MANPPGYVLSPEYPLTQTQYDAMRRMVSSLNTNYYVKHESEERPVQFKVQQYHIPMIQKLFAGWKRQNAIKGRQVYMTTLITLMMMDMCVHRPYFSAMVNNMTEPDQIRTIDEKFAYVIHHSPWLQKHIKGDPLKEGIKFKNGAKIGVGRSGRSRTTNFNLITEAAVTAEKFPDAYREVYVGTINGAQYYITIQETSPYGYNNQFIQLVRQSRELERTGKLTKLDFVNEFVPWHNKWNNRVTDPEIIEQTKPEISVEMDDYFATVESEVGKSLDIQQRVFYVIYLRTNCMSNPLIMRQEHPSTLDEALQTFSAAYILRENMDVAQAGGRINNFPVSQSAPCAVFWDFGAGRAHTAYSVMQLDRFVYPNHYKFINSYSEAGATTLPVWFSRIGALNLNIAHHFLPHDAGYENLVARKLTGSDCTTIYDAFLRAGIRNVSILPKLKNKRAGFEAANRFTFKCIFDKFGAQKFIDALYGATRKYDDKNDLVLEELDPANVHSHLYDTYELAALADEGNYLGMLQYRQDDTPRPTNDIFDGAYV